MADSYEGKLFYTNVLECVLNFIDVLDFFNDNASPEELKKFASILEVREKLHETLSDGITLLKAEKEKNNEIKTT